MKAQTIKGVVKDADTEMPLPFVNIFVSELYLGTVTDSAGYFELKNLTSSNLSIRISLIGYTGQQFTVHAGESSRPLEIHLKQEHVELSEMVISLPSGKLPADNIVGVESRKLSELNQNAHNSLMESLSGIAGVDQISSGTGIGKPVIRGLSGNRVVTYSQGMRIENQQWGSEHGLGVGEAGIQGVEVIKGPNSMLYGSDAIGGILYFTDEAYAKVNQIEGNLGSTFLSNSLSSQNSIGLKIHKGRFKQNFFGNFNSSADYKVPDGRRVLNTRYNQRNVKTSIGFNNDHWISNVRYSFLSNEFGIVEPDSIYHEGDGWNMQIPYQQIEDHKISMENVLFLGKSKLEVILGYQGNTRKEFEEDALDASLDMTLSTSNYNVRYHFAWPREHNKLIIGWQGMYQSNTNKGPEVLIPNAITFDNGAYGLWIHTVEKLQFQMGLRYDMRSLDGKKTALEDGSYIDALQRDFGSWNYSAGLKYGLDRNQFRLNISSGFRAPNTSELLSDGEHHGANRYEIGDPTLNSEQANQIDLAYTYKSEHLEIGINPYANLISDYIFLEITDSLVEGYQVYQYEQSDAILYGGEVNAHIHPHSIDWLHLEVLYANINGITTGNDYLALMPANNVKTTVKAELTGKNRMSTNELFVEHVFKFEQANTANNERTSPSYQLVNIGIMSRFRLKESSITIKAGISNVLNTTYIDHLSRFRENSIPGQGRNMYAGLNYAF